MTLKKKCKGHLRTSPLSLASSCVFILVLTTHKGLVIKTFIAPKKYVWNQGRGRNREGFYLVKNTPMLVFHMGSTPN